MTIRDLTEWIHPYILAGSAAPFSSPAPENLGECQVSMSQDTELVGKVATSAGIVLPFCSLVMGSARRSVCVSYVLVKRLQQDKPVGGSELDEQILRWHPLFEEPKSSGGLKALGGVALTTMRYDVRDVGYTGTVLSECSLTENGLSSPIMVLQ